MEHIQHFHHLFNTNPKSPAQNMIEVARPLEEHLPALMERLLKDGGRRAEVIAENSWRDLRERYISPAAKLVVLKTRVDMADQSVLAASATSAMPSAPTRPYNASRLIWRADPLHTNHSC